MGILSRMFERRGVRLDGGSSLELLGARRTMAGVAVSNHQAMAISAVFGCVRVISEAVSTLPLHIYRRRPGGGKERAESHPLYDIVHARPNPLMSSARLRMVLQGHLVGWGNAYVQIVRDRAERVRELWPLRPDRMTMTLDRSRERYAYHYGGRVFDESEILHIPGFGFDGVRGYSVLSLAREGIGLAMAAEEFGARFFGSGTHPGLVASHPGKLGEQAHENLRRSLASAYSGLGKSHKLLLLEEGMSVEKIGIPPNDAQFLETRKFQKTDICGFFLVPPHKIGDLERATFSNVEQQEISFATTTLRPWIVLWDQELALRLLPDSERGEYFFEHNLDGLLRGDFLARSQGYSQALTYGWMTINEVRAKENLNPIEGGDTPMVPLNMVPLDVALDQGPWSSPRLTDGPTWPDLHPGRSGARPREEADRARAEARSRALGGRARARRQYRRLLADAARRVVNRETIAVARAVKRHLGERSAQGLESWLTEFYADLPRHIHRELLAVLMSFAESIQEAAAGEVGAPTGMTPELERFVRDYLDGYSARHVDSSLGQLRQLMEQGDPATLAEDLQTRLDEWTETRPERIADNETVRGSSAITRFVFAAAGVRYLRWVARGSNACPYCQSLHGKIVGISEPFVADGQQHEPEGAGKKMQIYGPKSHPPLHRGCVCDIVAE